MTNRVLATTENLRRRRPLSSAFTLFAKYLFPAFWVVGFGFGVVMTFIDNRQGDADAPPTASMFCIWLTGSILLCILGVRIKRVDTDGVNLFISNFLEEIKVPLSNVSAVTEMPWISQRPVTIRFRLPTSFGDSVMFLPLKRRFGFWRPNPVVIELRQLASLDYQEPKPSVPLSLGVSKIPGSNWLARRLAGWDQVNPKTFILINLVLSLFVGAPNTIAWFCEGPTCQIPAAILAVSRYGIVPICGLIAVTGLFAWVRPDSRRVVLRMHGAAMMVGAISLMIWMCEITVVGIPAHTRFSWSPGFAEIFAYYATFLFTRYTLSENRRKTPFVFYLPLLMTLITIALDIGVLVSFAQMLKEVFSADEPPLPERHH